MCLVSCLVLFAREGGRRGGEREGMAVEVGEPMDDALRVWLEVHTVDIFLAQTQSVNGYRSDALASAPVTTAKLWREHGSSGN